MYTRRKPTSKSRGYTFLAIKGVVLIALIVCAVSAPQVLTGIFLHPILFFHVYHLFWLAALLLILKRFVPSLNMKMTSGKIFACNHAPKDAISERQEEKYRETKRQADKGALQSAVYWTIVVLAIGVLSFSGVFNTLWLFVVTWFFVFMDQFCITVWCPFKWFMQSKCCNTCRINNWGYLMAFSPLIYAPSFWTYSIVVASAVLVVYWEYVYARHPERFYEETNRNLTCRSCKNRLTCRE